LLRRTGIGTEWVNLGTPSSISGDNVTWSGLTSFSEFTIASDDSNPLPVELTFLTAKTDAGKVILKWSTANEINNYGFEIERMIVETRHASSLQFDWQSVGFVQGNGNSNSTKEYSFTDENPNSYKLKYRLKQIDSDGSISYSNEIEVQLGIPIEFALHQNYPNPFNPVTKIQYSLSNRQLVTLKVYDVLGNEVANLINEYKEPGKYEIDFNANELASGVYVYKLIAGPYSAIRKMVVLK
jgi:hypothetical protein